MTTVGRRPRGWLPPAVVAGLLLGMLVVATGLALTGQLDTDRYGWHWPAAVGGAAVLAALLLLAAGLLRERAARRAAPPARPLDDPRVHHVEVVAAEPDPVPSIVDDPEPDTAQLPVPDWAGGPTWGGELAHRPEPPPEPGVPVRGYVRGAGGRPIAEGALTLIDGTGGQVDRCRTGADGWYELSARHPGSHTLVIRCQGHQPRASAVDVDPAGIPVDLDVVLAGTAALAGAVRSGAGTPVTGATVALIGGDGAVCDSVPVTGTGRYRFDELVAGAYTLVVHAAGFTPAALPVTLVAGDIARHDVTMAGAAVLSGTARAAADDRPLPDTRVTLVDAAGRAVAELTTGPDGRYRFDGLAPGAYTVVAAGYPPTESRLRLTLGRPADHDLTLSHRAAR